ncbi:SEC-C domain-containing protein [Fibrella aquatica]|uniref:SEC-C domain-containing protein n=1 Tax=Fibrella aquatica TaxID=3242487 RepID=UPI003520EACF
MERSQITEHLNLITSDYRFIQILAIINYRDFCQTDIGILKANPYETLNYNEYKFLTGLWLKNCKPVFEQGSYNYHKILDETCGLMSALHNTYKSAFANLNRPKSYTENGEVFKEAFFYSGAGAFDSQYAKLSVDKYALDGVWLKNNKGFSPKSMNKFFNAIHTKFHNKLNDILYRRNLTNPLDLIGLFSLTYDEIVQGDIEFEAILNNISTSYDSRIVTELNDIGDYNPFLERPIIKLRDGRYFISVPLLVAEALYESPFYWMTKDKSYASLSLANRGVIGETITYSILNNVFGVKNVYRGVKIFKNKSKDITDIDLLVIHKNVGLIFQVKSKKLTTLSKQGNIDSIHNDFEKAIESAYLQGVTSKNSILDAAEYGFSCDDKDIGGKIKNIKKAYIVCLVLDYFPAIVHATQIMLYDKHSEFAIALNIPDLELICKLLKTPEKVVDYLIKRIKNCRNYYADSELSFLGYYIKKGLNPLKKDIAFVDFTYLNYVTTLYYKSFFERKNLMEEKLDDVRNVLCLCGSGKRYVECCSSKMGIQSDSIK